MTPSALQAVREALSPARIGTYENAVVVTGERAPSAIVLYDWNAQISGAFMVPLHICEVVMRNAVSDALSAVYGIRWPWSQGFTNSLPSPPRGYNPRSDLIKSRQAQLSTGKVIPEMKFVFWQKMFTQRHDERLWNAHLRRVLPQLQAVKTIPEMREEIYAGLEHVRLLRNRIAHHEPIFRRDLADELAKVSSLIRFRCPLTADWMMKNQRVTQFLFST